MTSASGGQTLTPNGNVNAPAGFGGDRWGANGGGITPAGGPANAVTNVKQALSNGQRETNSQYRFSSYGDSATVLADIATGAIRTIAADGGPVGPMTADDNTNTAWSADQEFPSVADSQL